MKRLMNIILYICLIALCFPVANADETDRVFDKAALLSSDDISIINAKIKDFQTTTNMDIVVLSSNEPHEKMSQSSIADSFYDENGFGLDDVKSGVLLFIDMAERQVYISTTGNMIDILTDSRIESVLDIIVPSLTATDYKGAILDGMVAILAYIKDGIPFGQFRYDIETGEIVSTGGETILSLFQRVKDLEKRVTDLETK